MISILFSPSIGSLISVHVLLDFLLQLLLLLLGHATSVDVLQ